MYKYDSERGFSAGLRMWLLCIIVLSFLGIRAELSILFGAAAGAAAWLIVSYWKFLPIPADSESDKKPTAVPTPSVFTRLRLPPVLPTENVRIPNPFARKPRKRI
jgi:xanthine/uracil permease